MESAVVNCFSPNDKVIITSNGKFGDRFIKLAETYGLNAIKLEYEWDKVVNPDDIKDQLKKNPDVKGVFVTQSETSTGVLSDVQRIGEIVKETEAILIVDSITGLGAVDTKTDEWCLDVVMSGSQKGLMLPPGLACVSVSEKAWKAVKNSKLPKFYFSYEKAKKSLDKNTTPFTPAVSLIIGLSEALRMIREEGLENVIQRHSILAMATCRGIEAMGLKLFAPPEGRGNAVTPAWVPDGIDGKALVKMMTNKYGITIAGGQDHLVGKIFRVGHLGYFERFDILTTLAGLEMCLSELGYKFDLGSGKTAAEKVFMENQF
jgi:aspartate aminotransferase-like enzyme